VVLWQTYSYKPKEVHFSPEFPIQFKGGNGMIDLGSHIATWAVLKLVVVPGSILARV